jgi:hypothetical protein
MEDIMSTLPTTACIPNPSNPNELIEVEKGTLGYRVLGSYSPQKVEEEAEAFNKTNGVTKAIAAAYLVGSMFGWGVPAAQPSSYDEEGNMKMSIIDEAMNKITKPSGDMYKALEEEAVNHDFDAVEAALNGICEAVATPQFKEKYGDIPSRTVMEKYLKEVCEEAIEAALMAWED